MVDMTLDIVVHHRSCGLPAGALHAVHDDQGVAAFDWRQLAAAPSG